MSGIVKAFMTPCLPQLVFGDGQAGHWETIRAGLREAARQCEAAKPDVLVIYSAQWVSVLGHSFQYAANPTGLHVDENWHDLGDFPFSFHVERELTATAERLAQAHGLQTRLVDYEGFPVDTATLVALHYFNPDNRIPVMILSSNIYANPEGATKLGQATGEAIRQSGKRAVLINCSLLSHRFLTEEVTSETDRFSRPEDDVLNRQMLDLLQQGQTSKALEFGPEYAQQAGAEMGFRGFYWMMGAMGSPAIPANVLAYGPLWGAGAGVLSYDLS